LKYLKQKFLALSLIVMSDPRALNLKAERDPTLLGLTIIPNPDLGQVACLDPIRGNNF